MAWYERRSEAPTRRVLAWTSITLAILCSVMWLLDVSSTIWGILALVSAGEAAYEFWQLRR